MQSVIDSKDYLVLIIILIYLQILAELKAKRYSWIAPSSEWVNCSYDSLLNVKHLPSKRFRLFKEAWNGTSFMFERD